MEWQNNLCVVSACYGQFIWLTCFRTGLFGIMVSIWMRTACHSLFTAARVMMILLDLCLAARASGVIRIFPVKTKTASIYVLLEFE